MQTNHFNFDIILLKMIQLFAFVLLCFLVIIFYCQRTKVLHKFPYPPLYPGAWPVLGHIPMVWSCNSKDYFKKQFEIIDYGMRTKQYVFVFKILFTRYYAVADPENCLTISNKCLNRDRYLSKFLRPWLGDGIFTARAESWKRQRKLLNRALNQKILDGFQKVFNSQAKLMVEDLSSHIGTGPFNHREYMDKISLGNLQLTMMSLEDDKEISILKTKYFEAIHGVLGVIMTRFLRIWLVYDFAFNWTHHRKQMDEYLQDIFALSEKVTNKIKAVRKLSNLEHRSSEIQLSNRPFLDLVMELQKIGKFTEKEAIDNINTMMIAGYDTVATSIGIALVVLGSYSDVQTTVRKEVEDVMGDKEDVEKQDLAQMRYLEAVIKEILRLYPIVPLIVRETDQGVQLKNFTIPAGSGVFLSLLGMNRHPVWGPDAGEFKPERWLDPNSSTKYSNVFGSFGFGRRNCIGMNYALLLMKTTLAQIIRSYSITADVTKIEFKLDILLKPVNGHYISLERIN